MASRSARKSTCACTQRKTLTWINGTESDAQAVTAINVTAVTTATPLYCKNKPNHCDDTGADEKND